MSGRLDFSMGFGPTGSQAQAARSLRIYIVGDFSGRDGDAVEPRPITAVDRDNLEQVIGKIKPIAHIDAGLALEFESMDDFHPDVWLRKVKMTADLLVLKKQLSNPVTATEAAAKIQAFLPSTAVSEQAPTAPAAEESQDDMLMRLLGKKTEPVHDEADTVARMLKAIVTPHVSQPAVPQHQNLMQVIDTVLNQIVRGILHSSAFQHLEALWRATEGLLQEEAADLHQFFLLDISPNGLLANQNAADNLAERLAQHVRKSDGEQEVVIVGNLSFGSSAEELALLAYCGKLATSVGGRFYAAAGNSLLQRLQNEGVGDFPAIPAERTLLLYPRYLLRLPYGETLEPIESFKLTECSPVPQTGELLWGCPAFLAARALLRISEQGLQAEALFFADVPVFSFERDGEQLLQAGTETVLTEAEAQTLLANGILPVIGYHQKRGVRLLGME